MLAGTTEVFIGKAVANTPVSNVGPAQLAQLEALVGPVRLLRPVDGGGGQGALVWQAVLSSGEQIAIKHHKHAGAGEVEFGVLHMLYGLGAPVVRPLQWNAEEQVLTTEWVGRCTLAAAIHEAAEHQATRARALPGLAQSVVRGCIGLETAFSGLAKRLPQRTEDEQQRRRDDVHERCRRATQTYVRIGEFFGFSVSQPWTAALRRAWQRVEDSLCAGRLTFGGRDCTPRNVLTDGLRVWFVDFAVVGLDWPEARLAQYAAAVAANEESQPFTSLLTHAEEQWYVESGCIESTQLDMHHLLLWSEAARLLLDGKLGTPASQGTLLEERMRQVLQLALFPIAPKSPAEPVRSLLTTVFENAFAERL